MIDYGWSELVYIFQSFWSMYGDTDKSKYDDKSQLKTESYSDFLKGHAEYLKEKARNDKFFISPDRAIVGAGKTNVKVWNLNFYIKMVRQTYGFIYMESYLFDSCPSWLDL